MEGSVKMHTVEHVLSALAGTGRGQRADRDGRERAADRRRQRGAYVELIKKAGIVEQDAARAYIEPREPIVVQTRRIAS